MLKVIKRLLKYIEEQRTITKSHDTWLGTKSNNERGIG